MPNTITLFDKDDASSVHGASNFWVYNCAFDGTAGIETIHWTYGAISNVDTTTDVLTFGRAHGKNTGDMIDFISSGGLPTGINFGQFYFVNALTATTMSLHPTAADARANTNRVDITSTGTGNHFINGEQDRRVFIRQILGGGAATSLTIGSGGSSVIVIPLAASAVFANERTPGALFSTKKGERLGLGSSAAVNLLVTISENRALHERY